MENFPGDIKQPETQNPSSLEVGGRVFKLEDPVAVKRSEQSGGALEVDAGWKLHKIDFEKNQVTVTRPHPDPEKKGKLQVVQDSITAFRGWQERAQREAAEPAKPPEPASAAPFSGGEIRRGENFHQTQEDLRAGIDERKPPFRGWKK